VIVAAIVLMLLLSEFGISIAPVPGAAGVAGVAVGLAAPGVAHDLITGISVLLDNQLRVGDAVEIAGMDRWEADTDVIRAHVPVAASAQASTRREWLARVKAGLDSAGVPNPTRRIRLLAGASNGG
jgi:small-conductance mechanosensitive channel